MQLIRISVVLSLAGCSLSTYIPPSFPSGIKHAKRSNDTGDSNTMYQLSTDTQYHFEILRVLGLAPYEGSDIGETLLAANRIQPGDFESWTSAFTTLADRALNRSMSIDASRFPVSARNAFFHAATYFRSADFFLHGNPDDPRINTLWDQQLAAFKQAASLLPSPAEHIVLNADGFDIPATFYGTGLPGRRPTVIMCNGYDGAQEEMYHAFGQAVVQRGMNAITFEGPGQPTVRRQQNIGFIPDWERVLSPVVDYALSRPDVDPSSVAAMGYSFGGLLIPRAAAFEHRLSAVIALDGVFDFGSMVLDELDTDLRGLYEAGDADQFNQAIEELLAAAETPTTVRWAIQQGIWSFNAPTPYDWVKMVQSYTLEGITQNITAPVFVGDAESDIFFAGQAKLLADNLGSRATYHLFADADGSGEHCSIGAAVLQSQVVLDWFEDIIANNQH